jgi:hypothetical protein
MYELKIMQAIKTLNNSEQKEVLDFAEFVNQKNMVKNKSNKFQNNKILNELDGIFKEYARPELVGKEKELAWEMAVKEKYKSGN